MRDLFIIITIISAACAFPLPVGEGDLDLFSSDFGSGVDLGLGSNLDPYSIGLEDPNQPLFLASSDTGNPEGTETIEQQSDTSNPPSSGSISGSDAWSVIPPGGDTSWTGVHRTGSRGDWPVKIKIPARLSFTINSDVNGPTSFELSQDQADALVTAGTLAIGGVTLIYNRVTGAFSALGDAIGWQPSIPGF